MKARLLPSVSYTHLDVYKRQTTRCALNWPSMPWPRTSRSSLPGATPNSASRDVYKRQLHDSAVRNGKPLDGQAVHQAEIRMRGQSFHGARHGQMSGSQDVETVSYTHLDVYKRQAWKKALPNGSAPGAAQIPGHFHLHGPKQGRHYWISPCRLQLRLSSNC